MRVGIPRGMLFYHYYPLWRTFFSELGAETAVSPATNKEVLGRGVAEAVDETCLPVKIFYGHVAWLLERGIDVVFVPRLVSVEKGAYICPKLLGLPDMIRNHFRLDGKIIDVTVNLNRKPRQLYRAVYETGRLFTKRPDCIYRAFCRGLECLKQYEKLLQRGLWPEEALAVMENRSGSREEKEKEGERLNLALIGHVYNLYDGYASMNLLTKLNRMGVRVFTPETLPWYLIQQRAATLPKPLFWTLGKRMVGAAFHYLADPTIHGVIYVAAFGCGPDSFTADIVSRQARRLRKPFLLLTVDEHSGEAGLVTRLEAFVDMVRWRLEKDENNLPAHG